MAWHCHVIFFSHCFGLFLLYSCSKISFKPTKLSVNINSRQKSNKIIGRIWKTLTMDIEEETDAAPVKKVGSPSTSKHRKNRQDDGSRSGSEYQSYSDRGSERGHSPRRSQSSDDSQDVAKDDMRLEGARNMSHGKPRPATKKRRDGNKHLTRIVKRKPAPKRRGTKRTKRRLQPLKRVIKAERAYSGHSVFSRVSRRSSVCRQCGHRVCRR